MISEMLMHRCLELAGRGRGNVGTNPMVGAVLVRDGNIIAEGWHKQFGHAHAERELLERLDQKISSDDVLYLNLEPCVHHGKTPPCTDLLLKCGIKNIVYGMRDPNPLVSGKGIERLLAAGVYVEGPVLPELCLRLNRGFVSLMEQGRPWITIKQARTRDGHIAHENGSPMNITSAEQDAWSHAWFRAKHDAIVVGVQTIITDDPQLNVRFMNKKSDQKKWQPYSIILDPHLRIPLTARVLRESPERTIIIASLGIAEPGLMKSLHSLGIRLFTLPVTHGNFDWQELWKSLTKPCDGFPGLTSMLIEGGSRTWDIFKNAAFIDEEIVLSGA